ncbi:hypothetical protein GF108_08295 [Phyllobacterium sp. SYP-B3895]|uniref:hypothetical protein n=1 Tax=Phyllobacterium sp. SYP-B3895 TaxID=2663240 RepID=UPI0012995CA3|nr:hypothetical protein [Phyllobacterium sp. SYP-B3895]MRG55581.1 hypothetical protein [Phyllobacterium sp. SYP-B3895]
MRRLLLASLLMTSAWPAFAQTVDADGAKALADTLAKYFGRTAIEGKIVNVAPEGDSYRVTLSTAELLKAIPGGGGYMEGDFGNYALLARPLADGTWNMSAATLPAGSIKMTTPTGPEALQWSFENAALSGVFDPKLGTFSKSDFSYDSFKMTSTSAVQDIEASAGPAKGHTTGMANPAGGVDVSNTQTASNFVESILMKSPPAPASDDGAAATAPEPAAPEQPLKAVVRSGDVSFSADAKGARNLEILDLWAFFVAHSDVKTLTDPQQAELKGKLLAALPLWEKLAGSYRFGGLDIDTPLGKFTAKTIAQEMDFDGISKDGGYHFALRTNGLTYPALPIPDWGLPFLPTDVELAFGAESIDLDTLVKAAVADMDLRRDEPFSDAFQSNAAAAFVTNPPKVVIDKSTVRTAESEITVEGEVSFAGMKPTSRTTWEMAGFDAALDRLNKAAEHEPEVKNYVVFAKLAKDFGTQLPNGHIQWIVDQQADGSVSVNGNAVKGPDPVATPDDDDALDGTMLDDNIIDPDAGSDSDNADAPKQ